MVELTVSWLAGVLMLVEPVCGGMLEDGGDEDDGIGSEEGIGCAGCAMSVGGGGGGTSCAKVTAASSNALLVTAVRNGLRNFMIDTPCQNAW